MPKPKGKLKVHSKLNNNIAVLHLFPGISKEFVLSVLNTPKLKAVVLLTFGSGNANTLPWFINALKEAINKKIIIYNVTQCNQGKVVQGMYETSSLLKKIGVVGGNDVTFESAVTKLMFLLNLNKSNNEIKKLLAQNMRGELTE